MSGAFFPPTTLPAYSVSTSFSFQFLRSCLTHMKEKHTINDNYPTTRYSAKTSTHILRRHLSECHTDDWIAACDKLGIDITAKAAQPAVKDYRKRHGEFVPTSQDAEDLRQKFSKEGFLDALVDFVTSEDVVRVSFFPVRKGSDEQV